LNLLKKHLDFTQNIDVTTYINGIKEKHNPEGRAYAPLVWDFFQVKAKIFLI
jgi:lysine-specific demethylase/histidyl-hydroxylase NO66